MKYFKNTSWLFAKKILRMVAGFFVGIWISRYLGSEQFGLSSYVQSFVCLFTVIAGLGLGLGGIIVRGLEYLNIILSKIILSKIIQLKNHQGFMKYFKNTSWLLSEKILRMIVGLFVGIWVARYLGPEQFGLFSYAQSFVGLFTAIAGLGLDGIIVRELVKDPSKQAILLGTAFRLKLIGALFVLIALAVAVQLSHQDSLTTLLIFIIASATVFQSFNVIDFFFQAKVLSKYVVYANIISLLISSLLKIGLIVSNAPLISFAWVILFDSLVLMLGFIYFFQRNSKINIKKLQFSQSIAIELLKDSWPLIIAGMSFVIFSNIDNIMIKEMVGEHAVGVYSAAYKLVTLWYFLPGLILNSLLPAMIKSKSNKEVFYSRVQYVTSLLIWVSILVAIVYTLFADFIIQVTYSRGYEDASVMLVVLSWVNVLIFFNSSWNKWMLIESKIRRTLVFHIVTAFFNIIFNFYFIEIYGAIGAAYALLGSLIITYIIFFLIYKEIFFMFLRSLFLVRHKLR